MIGVLDRYIARQFLINTAILLTILFTFVVAIDVSVNFDEYTRAASLNLRATPDAAPPPWAKTMVFSAGLVLDLWWPRLIQLGVYMLGMVAIAGAGFTLAQMVRHRELVAMLAGGMSLRRAARPILVCTSVLCLGQLAVQEFILPRVAPLLTRDVKQAGQRTLGAARLKLTADASGRVFHASSFDADQGVLTDLYIIERDAEGRGLRTISADKAVWTGGAWVLERGFARPFAETGGVPVPIARVETNLDPMTLRIRRFAGYRNSLSYRQASEMIDRRDLLSDPSSARVDELERIRLGRFGIVACNILGMLMALPLFLRREPIPMLLPAIKAAPIAMVALLGGVLGTTLSIPALPPGLSVFLPALALLPLAIAATTSVKS